MATNKKFELVDIDVDQMTLRDKRAFSALYKMLLTVDEVLVPLTVDTDHEQVCSFKQICLCFKALESALKNPLEINLIEQVDTEGNKFFEVALTKVKAIEGTGGELFPPPVEGKYSVRAPLQSELKRSNKKADADAVQADTVTADTVTADTVTADTETADAIADDTVTADTETADAIADDNMSIAVEIFAELKRKNFVKNQVKSTEVEDLIFKVIQKYFG